MVHRIIERGGDGRVTFPSEAFKAGMDKLQKLSKIDVLRIKNETLLKDIEYLESVYNARNREMSELMG